jgi:hypothetical protein
MMDRAVWAQRPVHLAGTPAGAALTVLDVVGAQDAGITSGGYGVGQIRPGAWLPHHAAIHAWVNRLEDDKR